MRESLEGASARAMTWLCEAAWQLSLIRVEDVNEGAQYGDDAGHGGRAYGCDMRFRDMGPSLDTSKGCPDTHRGLTAGRMHAPEVWKRVPDLRRAIPLPPSGQYPP